MKINHLAFVIASMFTAEAFAASNLLITKTAAGLTVTRSPHTPKISSGTTVTLTAQGVAVGSVATWSGSAVNCSNGSTCTFTMPNNVTTVNLSSVKVATPKPGPILPKPKPIPVPTYTLNVSVSPNGAGTVSGGGSYKANTPVVVTQTSNTGYAFLEWTDARCNKTASCRFVLNSNTNLTAKFVNKLPAPTLTTPSHGKAEILPNVRFTVATLTGASKYQLVVAKQGVQLSLDGLWGACANLDATQCKQTELQTSNIFTSGFSDLLKKDGSQWQWLVRGYDKDGVVGKWSTARTFTMASDKLPDFKYFVPEKTSTDGVCQPQCLVFVQKNLSLSGGKVIAANLWTQPYANYQNYPQGSQRLPKPGDILVWGKTLNPNIKYCKQYNGCGHVALVKSVDEVNKKIIRVDTNWKGTCNPLETTMSLEEKNGKYTISGSDSTHLLGWQSKD